MLRSIIARADFRIGYEPSTELLARGFEDPLLGDPLHILFVEDLAWWRNQVGAGSDERREIASPDGAQSSR